MKLIIGLLILVWFGQSLNICNNCMDANCNFNCTGLECEAFSYTPACAKQPGCIGGYCCPSTFYISYSAQTMNYTYCVACNYTFPGCVGCSYRDFCTQCQAPYINQGGLCYELNGKPVGAVPQWDAIWIAFVVLFGFFGISLLALSFIKSMKKGNSKNLNDTSESSQRRGTQLTKT